MKDLVKKAAGHQFIRKGVCAIEQYPNIYLWLCRIFSNRTGDIYQNYTQRRQEMLEALLVYEPLPRNLYFEVTNICNARCAFCGYDQLQRPRRTMGMELFKNVIHQYVKMGGRAVGFTPIVGDPALDKFLLERLSYLAGIDQITNISFYTNGIALTKEKVDWLADYQGALLNLSISFGGFDRETYKRIMGVDCFDTVKENVTYLLKNNKVLTNPQLVLKIDFRCPEHQRGDPFFQLLHEAIEQRRVKHDTLGNTFDTFGGFINERELQKAGLKRNFASPKLGPCDILFRKPLVLSDGRVNACAERDLETTLIIGDLKKDSLEGILGGAARRKLIDRFYTNDIPDVCKKCTVYQSIYDKKSKVWKKNLNWTPQVPVYET